MKKLFIWDFHGVLEKGNEGVVLQITNLALRQHGYSRQMTEKENDFLSGHRWHEYFAYLMPEQGETEWFKLQATCFEISQKQPELTFKHISLNDHADVVLNAIHNSQHSQILISNTLPESLDMFIKIVNVEKYFPRSHRFGANTHTQTVYTKKDCLNEFLRDKDPFDLFISIGDSPGDMALINQRIDAKGIGYLYSHPKKEHRETKCHYKINDLRLVLKEITAL